MSYQLIERALGVHWMVETGRDQRIWFRTARKSVIRRSRNCVWLITTTEFIVPSSKGSHVSFLLNKSLFLVWSFRRKCLGPVGWSSEESAWAAIDRELFCTESTSVLHYVKNKNKPFRTFAANRIAITRDGTDPDQWRHVNGDLSWGLLAKALLARERWTKGPEFFWKPKTL